MSGNRWIMHARSLLREPLVHFLVLGALIFAIMSGRPPDLGERRIVIDEPVVAGLADGFVRAFRRPPTPQELDGLIRDHLRQEVYYREALRLGLDRDDDVVRKRMRNKLSAVAGAEAQATTPSDADLQRLLYSNPDRYADPPILWFEHRYLGADTPAAQRLAAQAAASSSVPQSQPFPLPQRYAAITSSDVATQYGDGFAAALAEAEPGRWTGPVESGFGLHMVRLEKRNMPATPSLAAVRQRLENDWRSAAVRKSEDVQFAEMLRGYTVVIERPR